MERQSNIPTLRVLKMLDKIVDETDEDLLEAFLIEPEGDALLIGDLT